MAAQTEFLVEVVTLNDVTKHENADTLSIATVNGYPVIFRTGDYNRGDSAVYIPVDATVPTNRPEFAFLKKGEGERHRIKAIRLRGIFSMGLLVPCPPGAETWTHEELCKFFGIEKYIPPTERTALEHAARVDHLRNATHAKVGWMPQYGLDAFRRYAWVLNDGEQVVITEKIHGTNARFVYRDGQLHVGSHRTYRGASPTRWAQFWTRAKLKVQTFLGMKHRAHVVAVAGDVWWECAEKYDLENKLKQIPHHVVFGEIYGEGVQDLRYDSPSGRRFRVFDIYDLKAKRFVDFDELESITQRLELPLVPVLYVGGWSAACVEQFGSGRSTLALHLREGFVVKPVKERFHNRVGRVALKFVSEEYLLRKEAA